jgi:hypothetical protein
MPVPTTDEERLNQAFEFPLLQAIAHRRTRRFGLGYEMPSGSLQYKSEKEPLPLSDLETALLCWAGHGVNGVILSDYQTNLGANSTMDWVGKAHPSPCNDVARVHLILTNDHGIHVYHPTYASKPVELDSVDDRRKIMDFYRHDTETISEGRADIPSQSLMVANVWAANQPGSTCFFPVIDISVEYINYCMLTFQYQGIQIIDDKTGKPAGVQKWIDNGFLKGPKVRLLEQDTHVRQSTTAQGHYIAQNLSFAAEAMGLGYFIFGGFSAPAIMGATPFGRGLGFRFATGQDGLPNPVGIDGHIEAHCPPYFDDMGAAVDDVVQMKFGPGAPLSADYAGVTAFADWEAYMDGVQGFKDETYESVKDFCTYVYETYGRFPLYFDTMTIPMWLQVHHLDIDFYDKYFVPEVITDAHRNHIAEWHGS